MYRFTVRTYKDGVPQNPPDDEALPTVDAESPRAAAELVTGLGLTIEWRPQLYCRAEVWPYGKPMEKTFFFEPE